MHRLNVYLVSIMCLVALAVSTARAGPLSPADAMLVLDSPQAFAHEMAEGPDFPIRCTPDKSVGVWVGGDTSLAVAHLRVQDCTVGIVIEGAHTVQHARFKGNGTAAIMPGDDGSLTDGTLDGGDYGVVVLGNRNQLLRNAITNVEKDGLLIAGDSNTIEGNTISDSGRFGINVVSKVAMIGAFAIDLDTQWAARYNTIANNSVVGSGRRDLRQSPAKCMAPYPPHYGLLNTYFQNHYATKQPWCLQ